LHFSEAFEHVFVEFLCCLWFWECCWRSNVDDVVTMS
jgi:hypothetical protein